ncbi:hypothetical protein PAECIP111892_01525 [Paenibacillus auburnensis]|uniref:Uncharacterized protein n=1 Tax=Paenibacillus auburnensis TaxID=2905649 RepID=A0ABN8G5B6_9BACL|nr:hypothetical protein PAECIP111892_01525 [Paenibacillus auburnensis]
MKRKTRKISVGGTEYIYVINHAYKKHTSNISLKVSLRDSRNLTCTFQFCTWDDLILGSPILVGVDLNNKQINITEKYNLHHPRTVRDFIVYGLENGWTGDNVIVFQDGLDIISELGYDVLWLRPEKGRR